MSALILKSANHVYKILKVYLCLAIIGALGVIVVELFLAKPVVLLVTFFTFAAGAIVTLLWEQAHRLKFERRMKRKFENTNNETSKDLQDKPTKLTEELINLSFSKGTAENILGDLTEYVRLKRMCHYEKPKSTWSFELTAMMFHLTVRMMVHIMVVQMLFSVGREFINVTKFFKKESS